MKKLVYVLGILMFVFCFYSCSKSKLDIIEEEFKLYVNQNFDDPSSLEDILSIEINDTINNVYFDTLMLSVNTLDSLIHDESMNECLLAGLKNFSKK